jgi:hypothetical protein
MDSSHSSYDGESFSQRHNNSDIALDINRMVQESDCDHIITKPLVPATMTPQENNKVVDSVAGEDTNQKKRFLLFVKILFKELDRSEVSLEVRNIAKTIIFDCTRRNRLGDPDYTPLMDAVQRRLRHHVGEIHWRRTHLYMQHYVRRETSLKETRFPTPIRTATV